MVDFAIELRKEKAKQRFTAYEKRGFKFRALKPEESGREFAAVSFWKPGASNFRMRISIPYAGEDHATVYERWLDMVDQYVHFFEKNMGWVEAASEILADAKKRREGRDAVNSSEARAE
jgi:hypothetical protein